MKKLFNITNIQRKVLCLPLSYLIIFFLLVQTAFTQWEQVHTPISSGCRIYSMAKENNNLYLATDKGVFISTDNGMNWANKSNGLQLDMVYDIAISDDKIFVGTAWGLEYSSDNGETWNSTILYQPYRFVNDILVTKGHIFANMSAMLYKTSDNGETWTLCFKNTDEFAIQYNVRNITTINENNNVIWIGTNNGLFYSTDYGEEWHLNSFEGKQIKNFQTMDNYVLVLVEQQLYISKDNGDIWRNIDKINNIGSIAVHNEDIYYTSNSDSLEKELYFSGDLGETWELINIMNFESFRFFIFDEDFYLTGHSLNYSSDKGRTWSKKNKGLPYMRVRTIAIDGDDVYYGTLNGGVYKYNETDNTTVELSEGLRNLRVGIISYNDDILYVSITKTLYNSTDKGQTWKPILFNDSYRMLSLAFKGDSIYAGRDGIFGYGGGLFFSPDKGETWERIFEPNVAIQSIGIKGDRVFIGPRYTLVLYTDDNGKTWSPIKGGLFSSNVFDFLVKDEMIFVGGENWIYRSSDNGENWIWSDASLYGEISGLTTYKNTLFASIRGDGGNLGGGVYSSINNGVTWVDTGLDVNRVNDIAVNDKYIYAGTDQGLFRAKLEDITSVQEELPLTTDLLVYPNPVNETLNIRTEKNITRTELTDILGRTVFKQSGNVEQISTSGLAPGLYLLKLYTAGGEVLTEKVVVR